MPDPDLPLPANPQPEASQQEIAAASVEGIEKHTQRLNAREIFEAACDTAREELHRPALGLTFSAIAGGIIIGISALAVALIHAVWGTVHGAGLIAAMVYPFGFIAVIIGRAQFFTENTLYPVILVLSERNQLRRALWFGALILGANLLGTLIFAWLAVGSQALHPPMIAALAALGRNAANYPDGHIFWSAVIAGWLMALVAWMVTASRWTTGQIMVTWMLTFVIALGGFDHCVATSAEILSAVLAGVVSPGGYFRWLWAAVLGNTAGGVVLVSLLNYGQVKAGQVKADPAGPVAPPSRSAARPREPQNKAPGN